MIVERNIIIPEGRLICPKSNGGCGCDIFISGLYNTVNVSRIYLDCINCGYRINIPIDRFRFIERNTGSIEVK